MRKVLLKSHCFCSQCFIGRHVIFSRLIYRQLQAYRSIVLNTGTYTLTEIAITDMDASFIFRILCYNAGVEDPLKLGEQEREYNVETLGRVSAIEYSPKGGTYKFVMHKMSNRYVFTYMRRMGPSMF